MVGVFSLETGSAVSRTSRSWKNMPSVGKSGETPDMIFCMSKDGSSRAGCHDNSVNSDELRAVGTLPSLSSISSISLCTMPHRVCIRFFKSFCWRSSYAVSGECCHPRYHTFASSAAASASDIGLTCAMMLDSCFFSTSRRGSSNVV